MAKSTFFGPKSAKFRRFTPPNRGIASKLMTPGAAAPRGVNFPRSNSPKYGNYFLRFLRIAFNSFRISFNSVVCGCSIIPSHFFDIRCASVTARLKPFFFQLPFLSLYSFSIFLKLALYLRVYALIFLFFGITSLSEDIEAAESIGMPPSNVRYSSIVIRTSTILSTPCQTCSRNS